MFKTIVRPDREIIYVDMDDVFVDFRGAVEKAIAETPQIQFPQAVYKFYENLEPLPDAIMHWSIWDMKCFLQPDHHIKTSCVIRRRQCQ